MDNSPTFLVNSPKYFGRLIQNCQFYFYRKRNKKSPSSHSIDTNSHKYTIIYKDISSTSEITSILYRLKLAEPLTHLPGKRKVLKVASPCVRLRLRSRSRLRIRLRLRSRLRFHCLHVCVLLCVMQNGSDHMIYKTSHVKYNEKNKDAENIRLLDEEEEDDDLMLTVTLLHAAKKH